MAGALPIIQFADRSGLVDLGRGHPRPALLPVREWADAVADAVREYGPAALGYGYPAGPGPLVEWLAGRLGVPAAEVFVTAGGSHALDLVCALLVRPGDVVLVDSPTYHLALPILRDYAARLVPVPAGDAVAVADRVGELRAAGHRVPLLYVVPTFNNPTGQSLAGRAELVAAARRTGVAIVEDDTYRELSYDAGAPPALYGLAGGPPVIRVGSFAKTVAPGLRLGFLTADPALVARLATRGYVDSGGGVNHATAVTMASFCRSGRYDEHVTRIRTEYRAARDALVAAVARYLPAAEFTRPAGGWFLWLRLPPGADAGALLPGIEAHGVSYVPGARFCPEPGTGVGHLRLSFSMLEPELLAEGIRRLAAGLAAAEVTW